MIAGNNLRRIKCFSFIDRNGEWLGEIYPKPDEQFWGVPFQYYGTDQLPFIEVYRGENVIRSINCADVSDIFFAEDVT